MIADVSESLRISVASLVLGAGYVTYDLLGKVHVGTQRTFIGRMPARKGYPFRELYRKVKDKVQRENTASKGPETSTSATATGSR